MKPDVVTDLDARFTVKTTKHRHRHLLIDHLLHNIHFSHAIVDNEYRCFIYKESIYMCEKALMSQPINPQTDTFFFIAVFVSVLIIQHLKGS